MNKKFIGYNNILLICQVFYVFIFKKKGVGLNLGGLGHHRVRPSNTLVIPNKVAKKKWCQT